MTVYQVQLLATVLRGRIAKAQRLERGASAVEWVVISAILIAIASACACAAILWALLKTGLAWRLATDIPNDRSLHTRPTPRVGGWGIVPVVVLATVVLAPHLWLAALCAAALAAVSQIDDRRGLPARFFVCLKGRRTRVSPPASLTATLRPTDVRDDRRTIAIASRGAL